MILPSHISGSAPAFPSDARQITLVGGNGAGKSRFMEELTRLCGDSAYSLSALRAGFPAKEVDLVPGSIDDRYRRATRALPYMRTDAVSEIDKLMYLLFAEEFESLLALKDSRRDDREKVRLKPTRLDRLARIWENLFPDNRVVRRGGRLMFSTGAGDDLIPVDSLSQGEKSVLYYIAGALYAPQDAVIFVESPSLFIHPSILNGLWNSIEHLRPDCTFVYDSVDEDFVASRTENVCIWIKGYDSDRQAWNYDILESGALSEDLFLDLIGGRKPVLFIEGDASHSIDAKLYTLVFSDYTVRPLGSCDKVIETTRSFNSLKGMHHLDSHGIVDRDRRTEEEVGYLRRKQIMVPDVAEVENIFLLPGIIRVMAKRRGRDPKKVENRVRTSVLRLFKQRAEEQALQHVRHRVKREVECKIDGRFHCITAMETHIRQLINQLRPREHYLRIRSDFEMMIREGNYTGVLRVFNHKPMLADCGVAQLLGYSSKEAYIAGVLNALKEGGPDADALRASIKFCFGIKSDKDSR